MRISGYASVAFFTLFVSLSVTAHIFSPLRQCIWKCINQSSDDGCDLDIKCICQGSDVSFLQDVIACMGEECDNSIDTNLLLTSLQTACERAGTPITSVTFGSSYVEPRSSATQPTTLAIGSTSIYSSSLVVFTSSEASTGTVTRETSSRGYPSVTVSTHTTTDLEENTLTQTPTSSQAVVQSHSSNTGSSFGGIAVSTKGAVETVGSSTVGASMTARTIAPESPDSAPFQMQSKAAKATVDWWAIIGLIWGFILSA
jgi:hypothetical protein